MAYLAIRGAGAINGVSRLHGSVSRSIFQPLFPRWPVDEVPVGSVTNGVHTPSCDSEFADRLWTDACGSSRWLGNMEGIADRIRAVSDEAIWDLRSKNCQELVRFVRARGERQMASYGAPQELIENAKNLLDPNSLTIGFARRFATYKRPNLLLHDPERLARILTDPHRPVQLVIAGKAHPADQAGKDLIREWIHFIRRPEIRQHAIFLIDYDLLLAERIVGGVDVWINTPRRPWEASGTSGMKVLVNGGLNLSELDGWWAEAYSSEVGWAIGDGREHDDPAWDAAEAEQLYEVLERDVIPKFYRRDDYGMSREWIAMMRGSMASLTPEFSANRTVREYTEKYYLPAAAAFRKREASRGALAKEIVKSRSAIEENWRKLNFGPVHVETLGDFHLFRAQVYLGELSPDSVCVELYADSKNGEPSARQPTHRGDPLSGIVGGFSYSGQVPSYRPASDYTARMIPVFPEVSVPLGAANILWQN